MNRLKTVQKDGIIVEAYTYDSGGARTQADNTQRNITGRTSSYDDDSHLLTSGTTSYQYDLDGFLTSRTTTTGTTNYTYSSSGEFLNVTLEDGTLIEYLHDPLGRRIAKKVNGSITQKYLWQGLTTLLAVYDGSDNLLMRFKYADSRMPIAMEKQDSTFYLSYDQVGSLRAVADSSGKVVKQISYDTFGYILNDTDPPFEIPFGFAGGLHDRDTGLVRFGYRDYDPDIGRWTAKDPIFFSGGDTDLYGYVLNDPVNSIDPLGLWQITIGGGWGIAGYVTFGKNDEHWNLGGGIGFGLGLGGSYNPDKSDPNTPTASGNYNNGSAPSLGLKAQGAIGITKLAQATMGLSSMLKGDKKNSAWSTNLSGGASIFGLGGGGSITPELNRKNCDGEWSGHFSSKLDGSIGYGAYGFAGIGGGYTWQ